jgi:hypothetical protein
LPIRDIAGQLVEPGDQERCPAFPDRFQSHRRLGPVRLPVLDLDMLAYDGAAVLADERLAATRWPSNPSELSPPFTLAPESKQRPVSP